MSDFMRALESEIADLERQLLASPIYVKLQRAQELRRVYANSDVEPSPLAHINRPAARIARPSASGTSAAIVEAVREYLHGKTAPVRTRDLMDVLARDGIEVGGVTPQNSVSSLLSKTPDIISHGRKGWTLSRDMEKTGDAIPAKETSPGLFQPTSAPVEPGGEVAHEDMNAFR